MVTEVAEVKTEMVTGAIATKVVVEVSTIIIKDKAPALTNIKITTTVCILCVCDVFFKNTVLEFSLSWYFSHQ